MKTLDLNKPLRTKNGRPVELLTTMGRKDYPVIGYVGDETIPISWTRNGQVNEEHSIGYNLENILQKRSGWVLIKAGYLGHRSIHNPMQIYQTKEQAEKAAEGMLTHFIPAHIEWEE